MKSAALRWSNLVRAGLSDYACRFGLMLALTCPVGCSSTEPHARTALASAGLSDLENRPVDPFKVAAAKAIVLVFVRTDCPISNRYAPEIQRIYAEHVIRGVKFWLVYSDPEVLPNEIAIHRKEYELTLPVARDPRHALVKLAGARVTPEVAVFLPDGKQLYRGRIDDRFVELGKERQGPTRRDLEEVLSAIQNGRPITNANTVAVGCYIPELP